MMAISFDASQQPVKFNKWKELGCITRWEEKANPVPMNVVGLLVCLYETTVMKRDSGISLQERPCLSPPVC